MYNVEQDSPTTITNSWYADVCQYPMHGTFPSHLSARKKLSLIRMTKQGTQGQSNILPVEAWGDFKKAP